MNDILHCSFLGLNGGFWFIALPIGVIWISSYFYLKEKERNTLRTLEDFGVIEDIEEIELCRMEFKINKEEKWKIGQVLKREKYNNVDELIRNSLIEMISK